MDTELTTNRLQQIANPDRVHSLRAGEARSMAQEILRLRSQVMVQTDGDVDKMTKFHSISTVTTRHGGYIIFALDYEGNIWERETEMDGLGFKNYPWFKTELPNK